MQPNKIDLRIGDRWLATMPYSEVCMHMKIAGTKMLCEFTNTPYSPMVQLHSRDGRVFSAPISTGEAGVYHDKSNGFYTYGEVIN